MNTVFKIPLKNIDNYTNSKKKRIRKTKRSIMFFPYQYLKKNRMEKQILKCIEDQYQEQINCNSEANEASIQVLQDIEEYYSDIEDDIKKGYIKKG